MSTPIKIIRLHASAPLRDLISRGAAAVNMTPSQFILEASARAAQDALLDQAHFALTPDQMGEFHGLLQSPFSRNRRVSELLSKRAPWE